MMDFNSSSSIAAQFSALIDAGMQREHAKQRPRSCLLYTSDAADE